MLEAFITPTSLEEALHLKQQWGMDALFLGGGTELNCADHPVQARCLLHLAGLGLMGITRDDDGWHVGACTTLQALLEHADLPPALHEACRNVRNRNIRNQATLGGHVGANKSCADLLPVLVALRAQIELGSGTRLPLERVLWNKENDLFTWVHIPHPGQRRVAIENFSRTANDISLLNAAVSFHMDGGVLQHPVVALGGVAAHVLRLSSVEQALTGEPLPPAADVEAWVAAAVDPVDDMRGTATFKRHLAAVLVSRALGRAAK